MNHLLSFEYFEEIRKSKQEILQTFILFSIFWKHPRNPDTIFIKLDHKKSKCTLFEKWFEQSFRRFYWTFEVWVVQKYVNLVDLVKSFLRNI